MTERSGTCALEHFRAAHEERGSTEDLRDLNYPETGAQRPRNVTLLFSHRPNSF